MLGKRTLGLLLVTCLPFSPLEAVEPRAYELQAGSLIYFSCAACFTAPEQLVGGFELSEVDEIDGAKVYDVEFSSWSCVPFSNCVIQGSGALLVKGRLQRLALDIDHTTGEETLSFQLEGESTLPEDVPECFIDIQFSANIDHPTFEFLGLRIQAAPQVPSVGYRVLPGSVWETADGPLAVEGSFRLGEITPELYRIDGLTFGGTIVGGSDFARAGLGWYRRDLAAGEHSLVLNVGSNAPIVTRRLTSGTLADGGDFPRMEFELGDEFGRRLRILAEPTEPSPTRFLRGDVDGSGTLLLSDPIQLMNHLFLSGSALECASAADTNDSGSLDLSDAVYELNFLFLGGAEPPAPFPDCGMEATPDELPCEASSCA